MPRGTAFFHTTGEKSGLGGQGDAVVSSGRHRGERTRGEALPRHRGRCGSTDSWREVLLDLTRQGGGGARVGGRGRWGRGFPTREQRQNHRASADRRLIGSPYTSFDDSPPYGQE
jgi:hypothetical protein